MGYGGKRPGAGRKPGSKLATRTRAVAERLSAQGPTPLEVMLEAMQAHHAAGRVDEAAEIASKAAPYVHPRLAAVQHMSQADEFARMSCEELTAELHRRLKEYLGIDLDAGGKLIDAKPIKQGEE